MLMSGRCWRAADAGEWLMPDFAAGEHIARSHFSDNSNQAE
jgi:hypothetical protein